MTTREFALTTVYNVRHLGGYPTRDGRRTTCTDIIRSASLARLETPGIEVLHAHGVRTVVDLRSSKEREEQPSPDFRAHGIAVVSAAVFEEDTSPSGLARESFAGFAVVYGQMLDMGRPAYRTLFETIADTSGGILFHCAAGKDRTGVGAALLLELAGVGDDVIVEDYALTALLLQPMLEQWLPRMEERGYSREKALALLTANGEDMQATLHHLRERWGSAEQYLGECGLTAASIAAIRARLVA